MNKAEYGKMGAIASRETQLRLLSERIAYYEKNPTTCLYCHTPLIYKRRHLKFCNGSCAAKYNNPISKKKNKIQNTCQNCGKLTNNAKFCSERCSSQYVWKMTKNKIENNNGKRSPIVYRKYLLEKYGNTCKICGTTEWNGQDVPLVLDHIDGNSNNNDLSNLRMICHNCNGLLPTFAGRNKNSARKYRRDTYKRKYC